ncbi:hypothetical protein FISHEDRAFT_73937 [Fistulina hepatica ATCC 64428]|uniref:Uncharacterized protein n=1 Tax=Fistulina hepatica ATCC 64428 TaxID=1128425 RepID=A0A0D7AE27_9AGAR|nr:hypothetical protein FISHEDRAFT_73937 [Fistulina hepatica ATCC 64428]
MPFSTLSQMAVHMTSAVTTVYSILKHWTQLRMLCQHTPLHPFCNQVGGHNAIYQFMKRAVCKPLLLAFILRYLGVMLVTYQRVPKSSIAPPGRTLRPPPHKVATDRLEASSSIDQTDFNGDTIVDEDGNLDIAEAVMPEVALDACNWNIIPRWILHGGRHR